MTPTPAWPGAWRQTYQSPKGWWTRIICAWRQHRYHEQPHDHDGYGYEDRRSCDRCFAVWTRDGCAARQCPQEAVNA